MKHYGDITKINGAEAPVVDIITGGSPCQDLSVAGKRAGLAGERSGLFMEQMRIVKEMRERERATGRTGWMVRPRYMVWENVPGAFSSGNPKGADFAAVIEEIIKVAEPGASVSVCVPNGGWTKSGCYYAEDGSWSLAWRVHDAQFWGVPQRRKRIALVADFGGLSAPEILFERKGLSGDSEPCGEEREGVAAEAESGAGGTGFGETGIGYWQNGIQTLRAEGENRPSRPSNVIVSVHAKQDPTFVCAGFKHKASGTALGIGYEEEKAPSLIAGQESAVYDARGNGDGKTVCTITGDHQNCATDYTALCVGNGQANQSVSDKAGALNTMHDQQAVMVTAVDCRNGTENPDTNGTLQAKSNGGISYNLQNVCRTGQIVRRLTPLECERLQGYPDGWTDIGEWADSNGKKHGEADSPRYKALGNSIALPFWQWMARRICAQYERSVTMASLFDGIGGFPLVFQRCGAVPVWGSEIEEFPIAVTKVRFPDESV